MGDARKGSWTRPVWRRRCRPGMKLVVPTLHPSVGQLLGFWRPSLRPGRKPEPILNIHMAQGFHQCSVKHTKPPQESYTDQAEPARIGPSLPLHLQSIGILPLRNQLLDCYPGPDAQSMELPKLAMLV